MNESRPKQMTRRQAQVLAATVFLANLSYYGTVPEARQLSSWIGKRPKDAQKWLKRFKEIDNLFLTDGVHPKDDAIHDGRLATTVEEATCILAVHHELRKSSHKITDKYLYDLLPAHRGWLRLGIMNILRKKGYVTGGCLTPAGGAIGYTLTEKAMWHIPYLRILAKQA